MLNAQLSLSVNLTVGMKCLCKRCVPSAILQCTVIQNKRKSFKNVNFCYETIKKVMISGSYIPILHWNQQLFI